MNHSFKLLQVVGTVLLLAALMACGRNDYAMAAEPDEMASIFSKPGFFVKEHDGRLWVFKSDSQSLKEFKTHGEPAKFSTLVGAGPAGMTIRSDSKETIIAYLAAKKGFSTAVVDGRLWVLEENSESLKQFHDIGEPAKNATYIGKGPMRISVRTDSKETFIKYLAAKDGFWTTIKDERLWILKKGSASHKQMMEAGDIAKNITLIGKGPMNVSIRSDSKETVLAWAAQVTGFNTYIRDDRIWVFKPGCEDEKEFLSVGEPAKSVTRVGAGPMRKTIRSSDTETINTYIRSLKL